MLNPLRNSYLIDRQIWIKRSPITEMLYGSLTTSFSINLDISRMIAQSFRSGVFSNQMIDFERVVFGAMND